MKQEIDPKDTNRKEAFEHWMKSPMPMVTLTKTFNVTRLYELSKRKGYKFNMILCWCIAQAASKMEEFYLLPENGKLYKYDHLAINMIVNNIKGGLSFCDIASNDNLEEFNANYLYLTKTSSQTCQDMLDGHLQQSIHGMGQIPQRLVQDYLAYLFPVSSCADGWPAGYSLSC